jgi:small GTP-binding protein
MNKGDEDYYDMMFKVILIGDSGVGKSNILSRYLKDEFSIETKATVGVEFGSKRVDLNGVKVKIQIWDTAGQERYRSITNAYYKGSKGALLVYDISRKASFENVDKWMEELKMNSDGEVSVILIGNKSDMENEREVTREEGQAKATHYDIAFLETSAYQTLNIDKAFKIMIEGKIYLNKNHRNT